MKIGILAVQGDFAAHAAMLERLGVQTAEVRTPADLAGCDGLILPGGESTTQWQFLKEEGLGDAIQKFTKQGGAVFGTCAGAILLATEVQNPKQDSLKLLEMTVQRKYAGKPALVQCGNILAATFHPELTDDTTVHEHFLDLAVAKTNQEPNNTKYQT